MKKIWIMIVISGSLCADDFYGGAWSLRAESDVKLSFSWIANFSSPAMPSYTSFFIEPQIAISGCGMYVGHEFGFHAGNERSKNSWCKLRPKLGIMRTYNNPWMVEDNSNYMYTGIEASRTDFIYGINGQVGILFNEDKMYPSFGFGFGF